MKFKSFIIILLVLCTKTFAIEIIDKTIIFDKKRINLTKQYIKQHYNLDVKNINIKPQIIVIHHTGINSFEESYKRFHEATLPKDRPFIAKSGALNVSTHFLVKQDGTIYRLMPETFMARHVIGLNYSSIGIENVGGKDFEDNLTPAQLQANIDLIKYLRKKYPIKYTIGHYEYTNYEDDALWLEIDSKYRTTKHDPSPRFMKELREALKAK